MHSHSVILFWIVYCTNRYTNCIIINGYVHIAVLLKFYSGTWCTNCIRWSQDFEECFVSALIWLFSWYCNSQANGPFFTWITSFFFLKFLHALMFTFDMFSIIFESVGCKELIWCVFCFKWSRCKLGLSIQPCVDSACLERKKKSMREKKKKIKGESINMNKRTELMQNKTKKYIYY